MKTIEIKQTKVKKFSVNNETYQIKTNFYMSSKDLYFDDGSKALIVFGDLNRLQAFTRACFKIDKLQVVKRHTEPVNTVHPDMDYLVITAKEGTCFKEVVKGITKEKYTIIRFTIQEFKEVDYDCYEVCDC